MRFSTLQKYHPRPASDVKQDHALPTLATNRVYDKKKILSKEVQKFLWNNVLKSWLQARKELRKIPCKNILIFPAKINIFCRGHFGAKIQSLLCQVPKVQK